MLVEQLFSHLGFVFGIGSSLGCWLWKFGLKRKGREPEIFLTTCLTSSLYFKLARKEKERKKQRRPRLLA